MNIGGELNKIIEGDEKSFANYVRLNAAHLFNYAYGIIQNKELAEEIVSDTFLEMWKNRQDLASIRNLKAWLLTITYHKTISYIRKENRNAFVSLDEIDPIVLPPIQTPNELIISKEEVGKINRAIEQLPPKCKHVFYLAKIEGLPYKEIAEMLNISVKTINNQIAYALEFIAKTINYPRKK